jgi:hypothetical protein
MQIGRNGGQEVVVLVGDTSQMRPASCQPAQAAAQREATDGAEQGGTVRAVKPCAV